MTPEEEANVRGVFAVVAFIAPIAAYLGALYYFDLLTPWPITLGVTAALAVGRALADLTARDPYKELEENVWWDSLGMLIGLFPPELCVLTLYSRGLLSWWAVTIGVVGGLLLGVTIAIILIGDKDKPGLLRRRAAARRR